MSRPLTALLKHDKQSDKAVKHIAEKILTGNRISAKEALVLYQKAGLPLMGSLANFVREQKNGKNVYFIRNIHIEYTNKCVNHCAFCSFRSKTEKDAWEMTHEDILSCIRKSIGKGINEVHIVGGIHPERDLFFWLPVLKNIRELYPHLHIKAFTAAELDYIITRAGLEVDEGLELLKASGLNSIPGGGAEIFDDSIRARLFPTKISWKRWLGIHEAAHRKDIPSNATMLYGHVESIQNRIFHLEMLRNLQDKTGGFNAFIPLKYKSKNNTLKGLEETSLPEDLMIFALSRIFLDNFPHIKAYWPMLGKDTAMLAMDFGADDLDGTINDTTVIYSKAGAAEQNPMLGSDEILHLIKIHRKVAVERDGIYNPINKIEE